MASLLSLSLISVLSTPVHAVIPANTLTLTPAGTALGFTLTPIITGIPTVSQPWGTQGASSAIASKSGDILVSNTDSDELRVYSNSDKAKGSILKSKNQIIGLRSTQLTSMNGIIYGRVNVTTGIGDIIQLNDNGTIAKTIATNIPAGYPLVAAPALNSLFFGSDLGNAGIGQNGFY